jgi:hypothetical protein
MLLGDFGACRVLLFNDHNYGAPPFDEVIFLTHNQIRTVGGTPETAIIQHLNGRV